MKVLNALGLSKASDLVDQRMLRRVVDAMRLITRSQLAAATVLTWIGNPVTTATASDITAAARSYVGIAQWSKRAKAVRDGLLEQQRDALLDYLRGAGLPAKVKDTNTFPDENAIFDKYHIDMKMGAGFLTTRLAFVTRGVQYFIERCLRNLELVKLDETKSEHWQSFVSHYRVWQVAVDILMRPHAYTDIKLLSRRNERYLTFERSLTQRGSDQGGDSGRAT